MWPLNGKYHNIQWNYSTNKGSQRSCSPSLWNLTTAQQSVLAIATTFSLILKLSASRLAYQNLDIHSCQPPSDFFTLILQFLLLSSTFIPYYLFLSSIRHISMTHRPINKKISPNQTSKLSKNSAPIDLNHKQVRIMDEISHKKWKLQKIHGNNRQKMFQFKKIRLYIKQECQGQDIQSKMIIKFLGLFSSNFIFISNIIVIIDMQLFNYNCPLQILTNQDYIFNKFVYLSALPTMKESVAKQQTILDYEIMNSLCGQGNIKTIRQDNGFWRAYIGAETTRIKCKFKNICSPIYIELKILNASLLDVTCFYNNQEQSNELIHFSGKQRSSKQKLYYQFKKVIKEVDEISLDLHSYNKKQVQIIMIKFYGKIVRKRPLSKTQNPETEKDVKKKNIQETFKDRVKSNQKKEKQQNGQKQVEKQKIQKSQRKEQLQSKKLSQVGIHLPQNYDRDQLLDDDDIQVQKDYKTSFVKQQQINRIMNVNEKWLACQRKLQASFGVDIQHKLSVLLNPKCFHGMKFCIANIYGQEKSRYVKMIKELGGLVREDPSQNCIVVASNPKGNLIGMARLMAGTNIMKLDYIDDCYKKKQKLKYKSYQYRPEEYLI